MEGPIKIIYMDRTRGLGLHLIFGENNCILVKDTTPPAPSEVKGMFLNQLWYQTPQSNWQPITQCNNVTDIREFLKSNTQPLYFIFAKTPVAWSGVIDSREIKIPPNHTFLVNAASSEYGGAASQGEPVALEAAGEFNPNQIYTYTGHPISMKVNADDNSGQWKRVEHAVHRFREKLGERDGMFSEGMQFTIKDKVVYNGKNMINIHVVDNVHGWKTPLYVPNEKWGDAMFSSSPRVLPLTEGWVNLARLVGKTEPPLPTRLVSETDPELDTRALPSSGGGYKKSKKRKSKRRKSRKRSSKRKKSKRRSSKRRKYTKKNRR